jgi:probable rRNA maturation factor
MQRTIQFSLLNKTRGKLPRVAFAAIKKAVLGERYELSLALVTPKEARALTKKTKGKDKPSNVLSFPLSKHSGEIVICPATARREAAKYGTTAENFLAYLFIHGMVHLKGLDHGATMEKTERRYIAQCNVGIDL